MFLALPGDNARTQSGFSPFALSRDNPRMTESQIRECLAAHQKRNEALLARLAGLGVPLDAPRPIEHAFRAPTPEAVQLLEYGLVSREFRVSPAADRGGPPYRVQVETFWPPTVATDPRHIETFIRLAAIHRCEYDGWDTQT